MPLPPSKVLIIGAGPAGLISYHNLSTFGNFDNVTLYERRDNVGGVWYLDELVPHAPRQLDSQQKKVEILPTTACNGKATGRDPMPRWPSPSYPGLIGNVLPEFLSFSSFPFPKRKDPNQPFPTLKETHAFLRNFAEPFIREGKVKLNMEVLRVEELPEGRGWKVQTRNWNKGGEIMEESWDAVIIAVGWYDNTVWPNTPGLDILRERGLAQHAKWYRGPQGHEGKRALIVGNANSGNDIAAHLAPIARIPVYQSIRRPAFPGFPSLPDDRIQTVAPVERYELCSSLLSPSTSAEEVASDKITAHLQDGTVLTDIDVVYIATGYKPYPDFIYVLDPVVPSTPEKQEHKLMKLVDQNPHPSAGTRVPSLHRHILYAYNPSLAFIGSQISFTPFTISDVSSLWLTYVWNLSVPLLPASPSSLLEFERDRLSSIDHWRNNTENPSALYSYSVLGPSEEEFAEGLRKEVVNANPELDEQLPKWAPAEERKKWRERMYPMKFEALKYARDHSASSTSIPAASHIRTIPADMQNA